MKTSYQGDFSVYIHIPFCEVKCGYCDFYSVPRGWKEFDLQEQYVTSLLQEISQRSESFQGRHLHSIFFGGGTPSLLRSDLLEKILSELRRYFSWEPHTEITLETNPKTVDREKLRAFHSLGINRISLGVQSFQDKFLQVLGRIHSGREACQVIADATAAGFENVSLDLIFSLPGQTLSEWQQDLERALTLQTKHLSCYALTIEANTPFEKLYAQGKLCLPEEEEGLRQFSWTRERLHAAGFPAYEISNFARPGFESVHNRNYWHYGEYLGFGAGAASFVRGGEPDLFGVRRMNARDLNCYVQNKNIVEEDRIDLRTAQGEFVMLGLRTREGISAVRFEELFGVSFETTFGDVITPLIKRELLQQEGEPWRLTEQGILLANEIAQAFLP